MTTRRTLFRRAAAAAAVLMLPKPLAGLRGILADPDRERLAAWSGVLRAEGLTRDSIPFGRAAIRVAELAIGTPYEAFTLEAYLEAGGSPLEEPLALSLTRFDCVTLVEASLAIARAASGSARVTWPRFAREVERVRYRGGARSGYASRLHYFSEWITDGESRGLLRDLGSSLGGAEDVRPLRFMTEHRGSYPALAEASTFEAIATMERQLDGIPRMVVPAGRIEAVSDGIESGDVLAFATRIPGLDVTHAAFACRDDRNVLRVLHAPLSGGVVEMTVSTLPEYVAAIRSCTGIMVVRPLEGPAG